MHCGYPLSTYVDSGFCIGYISLTAATSNVVVLLYSGCYYDCTCRLAIPLLR
jgi:hypothetical protein